MGRGEAGKGKNRRWTEVKARVRESGKVHARMSVTRQTKATDAEKDDDKHAPYKHERDTAETSERTRGAPPVRAARSGRPKRPPCPRPPRHNGGAVNGTRAFTAAVAVAGSARSPSKGWAEAARCFAQSAGGVAVLAECGRSLAPL